MKVDRIREARIREGSLFSISFSNKTRKVQYISIVTVTRKRPSVTHFTQITYHLEETLLEVGENEINNDGKTQTAGIFINPTKKRAMF